MHRSIAVVIAVDFFFSFSSAICPRSLSCSGYEVHFLPVWIYVWKSAGYDGNLCFPGNILGPFAGSML